MVSLMIDNIIAVDFDGTLCKNRYPDIGEPIQEVIDKLLEEQKNGAKLILWTCRCDQELIDAVEWCERHGIIFDAVNDHLQELKEAFGNNTRKIFAHQYWDDRAVNILKEFGIVTMKLSVWENTLTAEQIKSENRYLWGKIKHLDEKLVIQKGLIDRQKEDIERLEADNKFLEDRRWKELSEVRAEAIKEFAERLMSKVVNTPFGVNCSGETDEYKEGCLRGLVAKQNNVIDMINNIVKEMAVNCDDNNI